MSANQTPLQQIDFALFCNRIGTSLPQHAKRWRKNELMTQAGRIVRSWRKYQIQRDGLNRRQMKALRDGTPLAALYVMTPMLGGEVVHHRMLWR